MLAELIVKATARQINEIYSIIKSEALLFVSILFNSYLQKAIRVKRIGHADVIPSNVKKSIFFSEYYVICYLVKVWHHTKIDNSNYI